MKNLVLLHGALGYAAQWDPWLPKLNDTFDVHVFEFAGHGSTPAPDRPFRVEQFADDLATFLVRKGIEHANIFGYSMGGYVALYLAQKNPALIGSIMTLATKFAWTPNAAELETKKLNPATIATKLPAYAATLEQRHTALGWRTVLERTATLMRALGDKPLINDDDLKSIANPVLVGIGGWDTMVSIDESAHAAEVLPKGQLRVFMDMPHPLDKVDVAEVIGALKGFI